MEAAGHGLTGSRRHLARVDVPAASTVRNCWRARENALGSLWLKGPWINPTGCPSCDGRPLAVAGVRASARADSSGDCSPEWNKPIGGRVATRQRHSRCFDENIVAVLNDENPIERVTSALPDTRRPKGSIRAALRGRSSTDQAFRHTPFEST